MGLPPATSTMPQTLAVNKALVHDALWTIDNDQPTLAHRLDEYKKLLIRNAELVFISSVTQMNDAQWVQYMAQVDALQNPVTGPGADHILQAAMGTDRFLQVDTFLKSLVNMREIVTNNWISPELVGSDITAQLLAGLGQELYDSGIVAESEVSSVQSIANPSAMVTQQMITAASAASLVATTAGSLIACIETNGAPKTTAEVAASDMTPAESASAIEEQKVTILTSFIDALKAKMTGVNNDMIVQMGLFNQLCNDMAKLLPARENRMFETSIPAKLGALDACIKAQQGAVKQFGVSAILRYVYVGSLKLTRNPPRQMVAALASEKYGSPLPYVEQILTQISTKYSAELASTT